MGPKPFWNAKTDAKLLCGLLAQLKNANIKIDYPALAKYMGPDCVAATVQNRINKLRSAAKGENTAADAFDGEKSPPTATSTPAASPSVKRKKAGTPRTPRPKKAKEEIVSEETSPKAKVNPAQQHTSPKELGQAPLQNEEAISGQKAAVDSEGSEDEPAIEV